MFYRRVIFLVVFYKMEFCIRMLKEINSLCIVNLFYNRFIKLINLVYND